jgi:hypothetical protein
MAEITPFELIDRGIDQTQSGVLAQVPTYGISGTERWSSLRATNDGYRVEPAAQQGALTRIACKEEQVWKLIESTPTLEGLRLSEAAGQRITQQRQDCVTESAAGSVVYVSLPWSPSDLVGPLSALAIALPFFCWFLSRWLLKRFVRQVERTIAGDPVATEAADPRMAQAPWFPLSVIELREGPRSRAFETARRFRRRKVAFYALIAVATAVLLAHGFTFAAGTPGSLRRNIALTVMLVWPLVPTLPLVLTHRHAFWRCLGGYVLVLLPTAWALGPSALVILAISFASSVGALTLLLPGTRAAQPWVLLFLVLLTLGAGVPLTLLQSEGPQRLLGSIAHAGGISAEPAILLVVVSGLGASAALAPLLARVAIWSVRHLRLSSSLVSFGIFWFLYAGALSLIIGVRDGQLLLRGLLGALPIALTIAAAVLLTRRRQTSGRRVLYLRSFNEGRRNVTTLTRLENWLAGVACVDLIAGRDVASKLVEPEELLGFVALKGARKFITDLPSFEQLRAAQSSQVYADGGHPIAHYFCRNQVWFAVFQRLARDCDAVVVDARGLTPNPHTGVARELIAVAHHVPLARIIVLVSEASRPHLDAILAIAWQSLPGVSPNRALVAPELTIVSDNHTDASALIAMKVCETFDAWPVHASLLETWSSHSATTLRSPRQA